MGNLKRDYLKDVEKNFYMITYAFIQAMEGLRNLDGVVTAPVWDVWTKSGMMTPSMKKNIKTAYTYLKKFIIETNDNMSDTFRNKLKLQSNDFDYKLVDSYTVKKIMRDAEDKLKYAVMERKYFEPIIEDIASVRCVGCTSNYEKCPLYKTLDDIHTPYVKECSNCPYACNLDEFTEENLDNIRLMRTVIEKKLNVPKEIGRKVEYNEVCNSDAKKEFTGDNGQCSSKCTIKNTPKRTTKKRKQSKKNRK